MPLPDLTSHFIKMLINNIFTSYLKLGQVQGSITLRATDRSREALISKAFWQGFRFESGTEEERNTPNNIILHFIRYQCVYHDFGFHF